MKKQNENQKLKYIKQNHVTQQAKHAYGLVLTSK